MSQGRRLPELRVHIDRLVLDGVSVAAVHRAGLHAHVERELTRLLLAGGLRPDLADGCALLTVPASVMHLPAQGQTSAAQLGHQIARSVYGAIGGGAG